MRDNILILVNQTSGLSFSLQENHFSIPRQERWNKTPSMHKSSILLYKAEAQWRPDKDFFFFLHCFHSYTCAFLRHLFPCNAFGNETTIPVSFLQNSHLLLHCSPLPFLQGFYDTHRENVTSNSKTENTFFWWSILYTMY